MRVSRVDGGASVYGAGENFTGTVRVDAAFETEQPARAKGSYVTFEPGARTNWHTHPLGQTLIITAGRGLVQTFGENVRTVVTGDVVWFAAGEKHWHGACPDCGMTHLAIVEALDGRTATWGEAVSDREYVSSR